MISCIRFLRLKTLNYIFYVKINTKKNYNNIVIIHDINQFHQN